MVNYSVTASAPGKVILFGEHAVVHGVTAIAAALSDLRIFVDMETVEETSGFSVTFVDIADEKGTSISKSYGFDKIRSILEPNSEPCKYVELEESVKKSLLEAYNFEPVNPAVSNPEETHVKINPAVSQGLSVASYLIATILPELVWSSNDTPYPNMGFKIRIKSDGLPIGAGLGSSAAFSVALTGACYRMRQRLFPDSEYSIEESDRTVSVHSPDSLQLAVINNLAYAAEVLLHGNPSGLDNTTSCHGGFVRFTRKYIPEGQFENISVEQMPSLNILLTNTKVPRSTKALVAGVKTLYHALPTVVQHIFDSIEAISIRFLTIIEELKTANEEDQARLTAEIGDLFRVNHHLLNALGVGHSSLTVVQEESHKLGMSCKLTGAGGGGCAITLVPKTSSKETLTELQANLSAHNFVTFQSAVGGKGLLWHDTSSI